MIFRYVCVAGTFDGLHAGHVVLLERAFEVGRRVLIGLTSDTYVKEYKNTIPAALYEARYTALVQWIGAHRYADRATIVPIDDPFEPAVSDGQLTAIVVSEQSLARGTELNRQRVVRGHQPLTLSMVPMVYGEDHKPISATRVREGVIDRTGRLTMPDSLRNDLTQPLGIVLSGTKIGESIMVHKSSHIISVGDQTTKTLLEEGITPRLMIIDNKVNRQPYTDLLPIIRPRHFTTKKIASGPGFISGEAILAIRTSLSGTGNEPLVLDVAGEDDLLALPAIIEAPIGWVVYYGQPPVPAWACGPEVSGIVEVIITQERKDAAKVLLGQFLQ